MDNPDSSVVPSTKRKTKAVDMYLEIFGVDVGKFLGAITLFAGVSAIYGMFFTLLYGQIYIDATGPIGIILGIALWRHAPGARIIVLVITWLVVAILIVILLVATISGTDHVTIFPTGGKHPALWQVYVATLSFAPLIWLNLLVLYSDKAKEEFKKRPTPAT